MNNKPNLKSFVVQRIFAGIGAIGFSIVSLMALHTQLNQGFEPFGGSISAFAAALAIICWWAALRYHFAVSRERIRLTMRGGFIVGGTCFLAGFLGPMILTPQANQGPLVGIFITGPIGLVFGIIIGYVYAYFHTRGQKYEEAVSQVCVDKFKNKREACLMGIAVLLFSVSMSLLSALVSGILNPLFKDISKEQVITNVAIYMIPYVVLIGFFFPGVKIPKIKSMKKGYINSFVAYSVGSIISYSVYIAFFVVPVKSFVGGAAILDGMWVMFSIALSAAMWAAFKFRNIEKNDG